MFVAAIFSLGVKLTFVVVIFSVGVRLAFVAVIFSVGVRPTFIAISSVEARPMFIGTIGISCLPLISDLEYRQLLRADERMECRTALPSVGKLIAEIINNTTRFAKCGEIFTRFPSRRRYRCANLVFLDAKLNRKPTDRTNNRVIALLFLFIASPPLHLPQS